MIGYKCDLHAAAVCVNSLPSINHPYQATYGFIELMYSSFGIVHACILIVLCLLNKAVCTQDVACESLKHITITKVAVHTKYPSNFSCFCYYSLLMRKMPQHVSLCSMDNRNIKLGMEDAI